MVFNPFKKDQPEIPGLLEAVRPADEEAFGFQPARFVPVWYRTYPADTRAWKNLSPRQRHAMRRAIRREDLRMRKQDVLFYGHEHDARFAMGCKKFTDAKGKSRAMPVGRIG